MVKATKPKKLSLFQATDHWEASADVDKTIVLVFSSSKEKREYAEKAFGDASLTHFFPELDDEADQDA